MLTFATDPNAARQEPELDVFSQRGLAQRYPVRSENVQDLDRGEASCVASFDFAEFRVVDHLVSRPGCPSVRLSKLEGPTSACEYILFSGSPKGLYAQNFAH